ncbi:MAG TPA: chloride channel protein [Devosiaceae bacterium]|jgi:H+/Cl- antiporter ClcA/CBS domain-containing protein|nr:chloride channel protein [Devosiaceae bacterium]
MSKTPPGNAAAASLGDFTTDRRVLLLLAMALVVGAGGTFAAWVLLRLIGLFTNLIWFGRLSTETVSLAGVHPSWWVVAAPALGGLAIGLMARFGSEAIRGHGIPEAIEAILIGGSRMHLKVAVLKPISSAISIGSGGPFGAEGPIIMTGGAIGSLFAQCFSLSAAERKTLLVAGAAAGMTAVFGTPIAAIFLAVELLLFEWKPRSLIPVIAAAITAASLRPLLIGSGALFPLSGGTSLPWWGIFPCVGIGLVAGLQSGLMTKLLYAVEDGFEHLPIHWMWWPALGGIVVGLGGLVDPAALGVGYDVIGELLSGKAVFGAVVMLLLVKSVIWLVSLSSGTSGGVLAPLLIMGGSLGWLLGLWLPGDPPFWALLGMAAMMGGTMRAPLTGVMFAVELSGAPGTLLPLIAATGTAYAVTVLLLKRSILTEKIARRGRHLTREYSTDPFEVVRAGEVMVANVDTLPATMSVDDAVAFFEADEPRHKSYPIVDGVGRLVGLVARADALRWRTEGGHGASTLYDMASDENVAFAHPSDLLGRVADIMVTHEVGRVPIVEEGSHRLVGLVARKDILHMRRLRMAQESERTPVLGTRGRAVRAS